MAKRKYYLNQNAKTGIEGNSNVPIEWLKETTEPESHPSPEQVMLRQAVRYLTPKQRAIWEYHTYDRLTQDEIAEKLHMKQPNVAISLKAIEKKIIKWCKSNMSAYNLIKEEMGEDNA